jgi:hypothetical protein
MFGSRLLSLALVLPPAAVPAAVPDGPRSTHESCVTTLGAEVCAWVVLDGAEVVEMGATIPMALIESVPADAEMVWPPQALLSIDLPEEARAALGIDHMTVNWEAHGHPPRSFLTQHFDFHFYSIATKDVGAIDCSDESKPAALPDGYALPDIDVPGMGVLVGLCVPQMGMHAMPTPDVSATDAFAASMMLGYYGGRPVFFEPMVARDFLLRRADFALPMPSVEGLPAGVRYPAEFRADFDAQADAYRLVFSGFDAN